MKLFLISQQKNGGYDTYDSAVVVAENEEIAQKISPDGYETNEDSWSWCKSQYVKVQYLGEAKEGTQQGVICASFNAG